MKLQKSCSVCDVSLKNNTAAIKVLFIKSFSVVFPLILSYHKDNLEGLKSVKPVLKVFSGYCPTVHVYFSFLKQMFQQLFDLSDWVLWHFEIFTHHVVITGKFQVSMTYVITGKSLEGGKENNTSHFANPVAKPLISVKLLLNKHLLSEARQCLFTLFWKTKCF